MSYLPLMVALLALGCSGAPLRDNPADPGSSVYDPDGTLVITVVNRDSEGLQNAEIFFGDPGYSVHTSGFGQASIDLPPGPHTFTIEHPGYIAEERDVTIPFRGRTTSTVTMNGSPSIDSLLSHTEVRQGESESSFFFWYVIDAQVSDPDGAGDIESVVYYHPDGTMQYQLLPTFPGSGWFTRAFDLEQDIDSLKEYLNQPFRVSVFDEYEDSISATSSITSFFLYKHLHEDMITPGPEDAINPTFEWLNARSLPNRDEVWFNPARYRLEVFLNGSSEHTIDTTVTYATEVDGELVDTFRVTWPGTLTSGADYDWRLTLYDPFGNLTRTTEYSFRPQ